MDMRAVFWVLVILVAGGGLGCLAIWLWPRPLLTAIARFAIVCFYRLRVRGLENIPQTGGALLVGNHVSWLDAFILGVSVLRISAGRQMRMLAWAGNMKSPFARWMTETYGTIYLTSNPKGIALALREAREALARGDLVVIFPEGGITRTGQVLGFRGGLSKILNGSSAPVIPFCFDELWGSIFSFSAGKFFWKWPGRWRYPVSLSFGRPLAATSDTSTIRQAVQEMSAAAYSDRQTPMTPVPRSFIRQCKRRKFSLKIADSLGTEMTGGKLLTGSLVLRRLLRRHVLSADERMVGVLLPPSCGGVLANTALALDKRVAVNLNYTVSQTVMNECLAIAGIKHVLTTRKFLEKLGFTPAGELVFIEDLKEKATTSDKSLSAAAAFAVPSWLLEWSLGLSSIQPNDLLTVIFTSGSTGTPKGVMLSHENIASNAEAIGQMVALTSRDGILGALPFFHSFGYTVTLWTVMALDIRGAYHFNPLDARQVGKLCQKYGLTVLLSTPTFLRAYLRRCEKEELKTVDVVVTGAEKLPPDLAAAFHEKFGVKPVEGYGTTELSPLVSVNVPPSRSRESFQPDAREGTVGRTVPAVVARIVHLETGETLGVDQPGMLQIKGPNVMLGYLNRPELSAECIRDGWYVTGDVALIDADGFIRITGRESRFSKIGGEMIPHIKIEETLNELLGAKEDGSIRAAVTAVHDAKRGERLIVLHTGLDQPVDEICQKLSAAGLPNLFIPSPDSFLTVEAIPILGTGKLDLKALRKLAEEKAAGG